MAQEPHGAGGESLMRLPGGTHKQIDLQVRLEVSEVLRTMGCGRRANVRDTVRELVVDLIAEASSVIQPRCAYAVYPVREMTSDKLELEGCPAIHGPIAGFLKPSTRVAAFVLTIGEATDERAREHMQQGELLTGFTWDAIGSAAADLSVDALTQHLMEHEAGADEAVTPPFSPGYCGILLDEQRTLFSIVQASAIGVELWPTLMMKPVKSVSGLMGIGPASEVVAHGVPCQWCDLTTCKMRR
jgi:hypothetical protein